jgi:hypothetical protein
VRRSVGSRTGLMAPRRPTGCGIQLRQRADEMVASVAGHGRKPVGEDVAPSAAWPREADRFRCTVAVSATAKNGSAQAIWAISASRFTWSLKRSEGTRNPLVAGSSAARPTKQMTYFCRASVGIRRLFIVNADRSVQELRPMRMYAATAHVAVPSWRRGSPVPYRKRPAGCPAAYPGRLSSSGSREPR